MRIVLDNNALEIEAYLPNKDIGFVKIGQKAVAKVESFRFTRYGTIDTIVTRVARDAIPEPDAAQAEGDPSHLRRDDRPSGAAHSKSRLRRHAEPLQTTVNVDGVAIPAWQSHPKSEQDPAASSNMSSPLVQVGFEAMKER